MQSQKPEHSQSVMLVVYVVKRKIKNFTSNILLFISIISYILIIFIVYLVLIKFYNVRKWNSLFIFLFSIQNNK